MGRYYDRAVERANRAFEDPADGGCQWLVQKASGNPEPDSPEDCYVIVPCGEPLDPAASGPFCTFHREPMEMDLMEFEDAIESGRSWS